jgi:hypothetical protein
MNLSSMKTISSMSDQKRLAFFDELLGQSCAMLCEHFPAPKQFDFDSPILTAFLSSIELHSVQSSYVVSHPELDRIIDEAKSNGAEDVFLRRVLWSLAKTAIAKWPPVGLPEGIRLLYVQDLERILVLLTESAPLMGFHDDEMQKNIAVLCGRLIPLGPNKGVIAKIGWRSTRKSGLWNTLHFLWYSITVLHGLKPMIITHTCAADPLAMMQWSSPSGHTAQFKNIAEYLLANPRIKGWGGKSWLLDPALVSVSPKIANTLFPSGLKFARYFIENATGDMEKMALEHSPHRRDLYDRKQYCPKVYLAMSSRRDILEWYRCNTS